MHPWIVAVVAPPSALPVTRAPRRTGATTVFTEELVSPQVAEVLARQQVKATFFLANERTQAVGNRPQGSTLDEHWAGWWKQLAAQGHDFGSHTWDHVVWQADRPAGMSIKPTAGERSGERMVMPDAAYCEQLQRPATRFEQMTGQRMRAIFRAPGGRTSPHLLAVAKPAGVLAHPARSEQSGTVANAVARRYGDASGRVEAVRPVHRLDRDTSGVLLFARDAATARRLSRGHGTRGLDRDYLAVVHGHPPTQGTIDCLTGPDPDHPVRQRVVGAEEANAGPRFRPNGEPIPRIAARL